MKKSVSRPQTLNVCDLDLALAEAKQRVAQVRELAAEECATVSGGLVRNSAEPASGWGGATTGYVPPPPSTWNVEQ